MKKIEIVKNNGGGVDLITRFTTRTTEKPIRIYTGKAETSLQYWKDLRDAAEKAIKEINTKPVVHVVFINDNNPKKNKRRVVRGFKTSITRKRNAKNKVS